MTLKQKKLFKTKMPDIIIYYHSIHEGDAIGNDIIQQFFCLKDIANVYIYTHDLYLENISLEDIQVINGKEFSRKTKNRETILIFHFAGEWNKIKTEIQESKCKIYLKYHNITPPNFFEKYDNDLNKKSIEARKNLRKIIKSNKINFYLPDSKYNGEELNKLGVSDEEIMVVPPFFNESAFQNNKINLDILKEEINDNINVLFVGRFAPNKGHRHLLNIIQRYVMTYNNKIQLTLIGRVSDNLEGYYSEILNLIADFGISENVKIRLGVNFADLFTYYTTSHLFLTCSEHEGFCVPIIEAQKLKVPVIAYDSSAVRDTLGDSQIIFSKMDYYKFASAINLIGHNLDYRIFLVEKGLENVERFTLEQTKITLLEALKLA